MRGGTGAEMTELSPMADALKQQVTETILQTMEVHAISQSDLAVALTVSQSTASRYLSGELPFPVHRIYDLARDAKTAPVAAALLKWITEPLGWKLTPPKPQLTLVEEPAETILLDLVQLASACRGYRRMNKAEKSKLVADLHTAVDRLAEGMKRK